METDIKKTSYEWAKIHGIGLTDFDGENIDILDPDGWDRQNLDNSYNELISCGEFQRRALNSTSQFKKNFTAIALIFQGIYNKYMTRKI